MKAQELIGKTADELKDSLLGLRKEQFSMRMQHISGQLTNPGQLRQIRRDIARVKTAQNGGLTAASADKAAAAPKAAKKPAAAKTAPAMKTTATKKPAAKKATKE